MAFDNFYQFNRIQFFLLAFFATESNGSNWTPPESPTQRFSPSKLHQRNNLADIRRSPIRQQNIDRVMNSNHLYASSSSDNSDPWNSDPADDFNMIPSQPQYFPGFEQPYPENPLRDQQFLQAIAIGSYMAIAGFFFVLFFRNLQFYDHASNIINTPKRILVRATILSVLGGEAVAGVTALFQQKHFKPFIKTMLSVCAAIEVIDFLNGVLKLLFGNTGYLTSEEAVAGMVWNAIFAVLCIASQSLNTWS